MPTWINLPTGRAAELHDAEIVVLHEGKPMVGRLTVTENGNGQCAVEVCISGEEGNRAWFMDIPLSHDQVTRIQAFPNRTDDDPKWVLR